MTSSGINGKPINLQTNVQALNGTPCTPRQPSAMADSRSVILQKLLQPSPAAVASHLARQGTSARRARHVPWFFLAHLLPSWKIGTSPNVGTLFYPPKANVLHAFVILTSYIFPLMPQRMFFKGNQTYLGSTASNR